MVDTSTPHGDANALLKFLPQLQKAANDTGVPIWLLGAIIMHESGGVPGKVQPDGLGRGLMQVDGGYHPEAYDPRMTGTSPSDIQFQISTGASILASDIKAAGGDMSQGIQAYAGSRYRGPNGESFAQELQTGYVPGVTRSLAFYAINHGNFSLANSLKDIPVIGGVIDTVQGASGVASDTASGLSSIAGTLGKVTGFFSDQQNWIAIVIGVGGFLLVMGGLFIAFSNSNTGQEVAGVGKEAAVGAAGA